MSDIPEECPGVASSKAGVSEACDGCPNQKLCASGSFDLTIADKIAKDVEKAFQNIKYIVLVFSGKGGVGKSTLTSLIARGLTEFYSASVGVLDLDICGPSIADILSVEGDIYRSSSGYCPLLNDDGILVFSTSLLLDSKDEAIIWKETKKNTLVKKFLLEVDWGDLDYLIIDTPPGTSDEHISLLSFLKYVKNVSAVVVTTPQEISQQDVRKSVNFLKKMGVDILVEVENMKSLTCPICKKVQDFNYSDHKSKVIGIEMDLHLMQCLENEVNPLLVHESFKSGFYHATKQLCDIIHEKQLSYQK